MMDPFRLLRLVWHNTKTDTKVEQVAVPTGEKTAAPEDVAPDVHVTIEEMPEPTPKADTDADVAGLAAISTAAAPENQETSQPTR